MISGQDRTQVIRTEGLTQRFLNMFEKKVGRSSVVDVIMWHNFLLKHTTGADSSLTSMMEKGYQFDIKIIC